MGMAKTVFKDIPFFGNLVDGFDFILDLTGAFGGNSGGGSVSKEDLKELREHLDSELEKLNQQIILLGAQLLNELGNEMYTMKIGDVIDDMYGTAVRDAERMINTHLSDNSLTENEKLVEIAAPSPTQRDILSRSTVKSIEDEIGAETMMLFNFHDQKSSISLYSKYLYNAENSPQNTRI